MNGLDRGGFKAAGHAGQMVATVKPGDKPVGFDSSAATPLPKIPADSPATDGGPQPPKSGPPVLPKDREGGGPANHKGAGKDSSPEKPNNISGGGGAGGPPVVNGPGNSPEEDPKEPRPLVGQPISSAERRRWNSRQVRDPGFLSRVPVPWSDSYSPQTWLKVGLPVAAVVGVAVGAGAAALFPFLGYLAVAHLPLAFAQFAAFCLGNLINYVFPGLAAYFGLFAFGRTMDVFWKQARNALYRRTVEPFIESESERNSTPRMLQHFEEGLYNLMGFMADCLTGVRKEYVHAKLNEAKVMLDWLGLARPDLIQRRTDYTRIKAGEKPGEGAPTGEGEIIRIFQQGGLAQFGALREISEARNVYAQKVLDELAEFLDSPANFRPATQDEQNAYRNTEPDCTDVAPGVLVHTIHKGGKYHPMMHRTNSALLGDIINREDRDHKLLRHFKTLFNNWLEIVKARRLHNTSADLRGQRGERDVIVNYIKNVISLCGGREAKDIGRTIHGLVPQALKIHSPFLYYVLKVFDKLDLGSGKTENWFFGIVKSAFIITPVSWAFYSVSKVPFDWIFVKSAAASLFSTSTLSAAFGLLTSPWLLGAAAIVGGLWLARRAYRSWCSSYIRAREPGFYEALAKIPDAAVRGEYLRSPYTVGPKGK